MSGTFPTTPLPSQMTVKSIQPTRVSTTQNLRRQVRGGTVQRWGFALQWDALRREELAPLHAFALAQRGQYEAFTFTPPVMGSAQTAPANIGVTRASVGTHFDAAGVLRTALANVARYDHDPVTLAPLGLMGEAAATNYIANTATTTAAFAAVVSAGTATGPNGLVAYKVVPNAGAVAGPARGNLTVQMIPLTTTVGQTTDVSLTYYFAPHGPLNYKPYLVTAAQIGATSQAYALIRFNAVAGTFNGKTLNAGWTEIIAPAAVLLPCGMWRVTWSIRWTQPATVKDRIIGVFQISNEADTQTYTADGLSGVQYACMQMEVGPFPTSYIPTTTAPATRAAETAVPNSPPLVNGATASGRAVPTDGWPSFMRVMRAGDFIKFGGHNKVYMLTADATSNGAGQATLAIEPGLYAAVADNAAVTHSAVPFTVAFAADTQETGINPPFLATFACELVEVL